MKRQVITTYFTIPKRLRTNMAIQLGTEYISRSTQDLYSKVDSLGGLPIKSDKSPATYMVPPYSQGIYMDLLIRSSH